MRHSCVLFVGVVCVLVSSVLGSYEGGYGATHDLDDFYETSYPAPPIVHPHHGHGHSAGSYYHYHVPLVGQQQQHYPPQHYHQDHSHYLWPLLLLLALPLLFLPLLPLLLLPLGISLLALLAPGGMMMMMMMMMMMGGEMMRRDTISGRAFSEIQTFGEVLYVDMTSLLTKYARSLDLDQCPQRVACEMGAVFFPEKNGTDSSTAKAFSNFIMDQYIPKGKVKRTIKQFEKAFWSGSTNIKSCDAFPCHPTFKIYKDVGLDPLTEDKSGSLPLPTHSAKFNESHKEASSDYKKNIKVNFVYPAQPKGKPNANDSIGAEWKSLPSSKPNDKTKHKRSHHYQQHIYSNLSKDKYRTTSQSAIVDDPISSQGNKGSYFKMFGTPTVQS